jgi:hypothetical protein
MLRALLALSLLVTGCASTGGGGATGGADGAQEAFDNLTGNDMQAVLTEMGLVWERSVDPDGDPVFLVEIAGTKTLLFMYRGKSGAAGEYYSLQLSAAFGFPEGIGPDLNSINKWNYDKRFCRAFLDSDEDPVLQSELFMDGGVTPETVRRFLERFEWAVRDFRTHIGFDGRKEPERRVI